MEPHGAVCRWEGKDRVEIWASTQAPFAVQQTVADMFGLPHAQVRVARPVPGWRLWRKIRRHDRTPGGLRGKSCARRCSPLHLQPQRGHDEHGPRPRDESAGRLGAGRTARSRLSRRSFTFQTVLTEMPPPTSSRWRDTTVWVPMRLSTAT